MEPTILWNTAWECIWHRLPEEFKTALSTEGFTSDPTDARLYSITMDRHEKGSLTAIDTIRKRIATALTHKEPTCDGDNLEEEEPSQEMLTSTDKVLARLKEAANATAR